MDIIQSYSIVELCFFLIRKVSKAVPYIVQYLCRRSKDMVLYIDYYSGC